MSMTDPIADMLTRVRNANAAFHKSVAMPSSKKLVEIARIMKEEGYIDEFVVTPGEPQATLEITLKYGRRSSGPSQVSAASASPACASTPRRMRSLASSAAWAAQ